MRNLFIKYCLPNDLATYDPYDIWKTNIGLKLKYLFNTHRIIAALPAFGFSCFDLFVNNNIRLGYQKQEYAIVRALAAQTLLLEYERSANVEFLSAAKRHLKWLEGNFCKGYSGPCWGIGFKWPAFGSVIYDANVPHSTHTPYILEAFNQYNQIVDNHEFDDLIRRCFQFYEQDLHIMYEDNDMMAVSYGPCEDKVVTNATSYTLYAYCIFLSYFPEKEEYILSKIFKLYHFIVAKQQFDGSWLYSPDDTNSFIDCFHSCIIIKNLIKASKIVNLKGVEAIVASGYNYIISHFFSKKYGLYKRFTKSNKLTLTRFDLYDNAEVLNLANMMGDTQRVTALNHAINKHFIIGEKIYSMIDYLGVRRNSDTLRWAIMPYLYSISTLK